MLRSSGKTQPVSEPVESVEKQIALIAAMSVTELRRKWREVIGAEPPPAFSKDPLARALSDRLQQPVYGGLSTATVRLLRSLAKPGAEPPRRVKVGSVIVREHKGVLHEVMITPGGYVWRENTYASLSTIARAITGTAWNGPRFFGLRTRRAQSERPAKRSAGNPGRPRRNATSSGRCNREGTRTKALRHLHPQIDRA